jgi:competence protein CoiA
MKYAIVNNIKAEAIKGVIGTCPNCRAELIAKCGNIKIHHWSHKRLNNCDNWWETETAWHRNWKNNYPVDWQEISMKDSKSGEKHIADILTGDNLVIEFQHSFINSTERQSREVFYKNMVWVIDGRRLKLDYPRFLKGMDTFRPVRKGISLLYFPEEYISSSWLGSKMPIILDFNKYQSTDDSAPALIPLYCIFPVRIDGAAVIAEISIRAFLNTTKNGQWIQRTSNFISDLLIVKKEKEDQDQRKLRNIGYQKLLGKPIVRKRKRF